MKFSRLKKILLVDADSTIPNIALGKISTFYKTKGYSVDFLRLNIPYYPNKKKIRHVLDTEKYDKAFCSVIYKENKNFVYGENVEFGGSGFCLDKTLPIAVENCQVDYSLWPDNDISYGFLSRGCIRNCSFCVVPKKEGKLRQVDYVDNIIKHKKVKFLDNNFLALHNHKVLLMELINKNIKCQFNQGLDIRLVDNENSVLLSKLNYLGEYIFAYDDISFTEIIFNKLKILNWRKDWQFKFFVYINPKDNLNSAIQRINILKDNKILPYVMRDITCWESDYSDFFVDLASWANQPNIFKNMEFVNFLDKRHSNKHRADKSKELYNLNKGKL